MEKETLEVLRLYYQAKLDDANDEVKECQDAIDIIYGLSLLPPEDLCKVPDIHQPFVLILEH